MALTDYNFEPKTRHKICETVYIDLITENPALRYQKSGQEAVVCDGVMARQYRVFSWLHGFIHLVRLSE